MGAEASVPWNNSVPSLSLHSLAPVSSPKMLPAKSTLVSPFPGSWLCLLPPCSCQALGSSIPALLPPTGPPSLAAFLMTRPTSYSLPPPYGVQGLAQSGASLHDSRMNEPMGYVLGLIYSSSSSTLSCVSVFISIWVSGTEGWTLGEVAESWRSGRNGRRAGLGSILLWVPLWAGHVKLICLWTHSLPQAGKSGPQG